MIPVRCAIYTRKSSEEGLEQDFNSLDAQREACAAYVLSQASEGWQLLPELYDDGGISGGTLERPALQRLLADVAAGKIDIIVVYKIDRLTRSLLDFAKLVEALEKAGTSFVSVTQSFNTTTSMGRLTLNMLLSFAQFEREVTAERIRDKIAASKAKGMWMGGIPPLGYKANGRSLAVVEEHAALIRGIYARYARLGNVRLVAEQLAGEGIMTPVRRSGTGRRFGGRPFSRGALYALLRNPVYAGDIAHRGKVSPGNHPAIIAREQWEAVQQKLSAQVKGTRGKRAPSRNVLAGLIRDGAGEPMLAAHSCKKLPGSKARQRYRYYVSRSLHLGESSESGMRVPAGEIEDAAAAQLARLFDDPLLLIERAQLDIAPAKLMPLVERCGKLAGQLRKEGIASLTQLISQVRIHDSSIDVIVAGKGVADALAAPLKPLAPQSFTVSSQVRLTRTGRAIRLVQGNGLHASGSRGDPALAALILRGRQWWTRLRQETIGPADLAREEGVSSSYITRVMRLAFLAPRVTEGIMQGQLRAGTDRAHLLRHGAIPESWQEQEEKFLAG